MIVREARKRPVPLSTRKSALKWMLPFVVIEWTWEWIAFGLGKWAFLEVLEYLGSFSVLVAVIFYFSESGDRIKLRHYQAWQVINTAQGKGGSGGRIEALQELNQDNVPLVGVDVSSAFLQGLRLNHANLLRSDFSSADLRNANLSDSNLTLANLNSANLRSANLNHALLVQADLRESDLTACNLNGADLTGASLDDADLRAADLRNLKWQGLKSVSNANLAGVQNSPSGFVEWALAHGAVAQPALKSE